MDLSFLDVFSKIVFDQPSHTYKINGKQLISTTTATKRLVPIFDKDKISKRTAAKQGLTQQQVLNDWENRGKIALDKGTRVHSYAEDLYAGKIDPIKKFMNKRLPEMEALDEIWTLMTKKLNAVVIGQEITIGDEEFGIAGRIDLLVEIDDGHGGRIRCIFDWKTGKFSTSNQYDKLLAPFHKYDNSKLAIYSLQQSLYRLMFERNTGLEMGDPYLVHLRDDGTFMVHRAFDMRQQLEDWLATKPLYDPDKESAAQRIIQILDSIDVNFFRDITDESASKIISSIERINGIDHSSDIED